MGVLHCFLLSWLILLWFFFFAINFDLFGDCSITSELLIGCYLIFSLEIQKLKKIGFYAYKITVISSTQQQLPLTNTYRAGIL